MADTKYTPGPWTHEDGSFHGGRPGYGGFKIKDAEGRSVAAYPSSGTRDEEEQLATATLIAAAPEMLEALRNLRRVGEVALSALDPRTKLSESLAAAVLAANAVIDKAEGK